MDDKVIESNENHPKKSQFEKTVKTSAKKEADERLNKLFTTECIKEKNVF
jgi:hypothetical protein